MKFELDGIVLTEEEREAWILHMHTDLPVSTIRRNGKVYGFKDNRFVTLYPASCQEEGFYIRYEDLLLLAREVVNFYA